MEFSPKKQVTFNDIDSYINQCISDLDSCLLVFENQCHATNLLLVEISNKKDKLDQLHMRLNLLKYIQMNTDQDILQTQVNQNKIEETVQKLETEISNHNKDIPQDMYREKMYKIAEDVGSTLQYYNTLAEDNLSTAKNKFKTALENPFEAIGQILMTDLDMLEQIQMKTQTIVNLLNLNENKQNEYLKKLKSRKHKSK